MTTQASIQRQVTLPQPPDAVWRALTESAALADWMMPNDFQPRVGHRFTFQSQPNPQYGFDGLIHCEVLECTPPSSLAYTWDAGPLQGTRVSYRLEPAGAGTTLHFEHTGFDTSQEWSGGVVQGAEQGWDWMLGRLEQAVAALTPAR
jgi:uncharacterized protein YndB with AHSA1/START domain